MFKCMSDHHLRYPIGEFVMPNVITVNDLQRWTEVIGAFPMELQQEVSTLSEKQLDTSYRSIRMAG